jgi:methyl-accepting chemotaxis protein
MPKPAISAVIERGGDQGSRVGQVRQRDLAARLRLVRLACDLMAVVSVIVTTTFALTIGLRVAAYPAACFVVALVARQLTQTKAYVDWAPRVLSFGIAGVIALFLLFSGQAGSYGAAKIGLALLSVLYVFIAPARSGSVFTGVAVAIAALATVTQGAQAGWPGDMMAGLIAECFILGALCLVCIVLRRQDLSKERALGDYVEDIEAMVQRARRVARGDLSGSVEGNDELSLVVREMLSGLRALVDQMRMSVQVLRTAAMEMSAMIAEQDRGAAQQASAVAETRHTVEGFAQSSVRIADSSRGVLENAEQTLANSHRASDHIGQLSTHMQRISELLEFIKEVSNKSEILALNAALEGTKAGEAGKGFSLVAAQMQRLAESTMATVKDAKVLITDINSATSATVVSMEQTTKIAADTTRVARDISLITQEQGVSASQIVDAMKDIANVTSEFAASNKDTLAAIEEIRRLSDRLAELVNRFVLEDGGVPTSGRVLSAAAE